MALVENGRFSTKPFARVSPLGDLPGIVPSQDSVSDVPSNDEGLASLDLSEGCMVTKSIKYTHTTIHWIDVPPNVDPTDVDTLLQDLKICPYPDVTVDDPCNLALLEPFIQTSLDVYAFVAVTPSMSTLQQLITMVQMDNQRRQERLDTAGVNHKRSLDFSISGFTNPEYELVALHPEHFLPAGSMLTVYDPEARIHKNYVPARDRCLRETSEPSSPRLPAFHHKLDRQCVSDRLNVFLVAINAEIKFRRYLQKKLDPPEKTLPKDVLDLMHRTQELIELIYWEGKPTKGSAGEVISAELQALRGPRGKSTKGRRELPWPKDADLQTRMAYGRALMDSYDPGNLPDTTFPLRDSLLYSDETSSEGTAEETPTATSTLETLANTIKDMGERIVDTQRAILFQSHELSLNRTMTDLKSDTLSLKVKLLLENDEGKKRDINTLLGSMEEEEKRLKMEISKTNHDFLGMMQGASVSVDRPDDISS